MKVFRQVIRGDWCVLVTDDPFDSEKFDVWIMKRGYGHMVHHFGGTLNRGELPKIDCDAILLEDVYSYDYDEEFL